MKLAGLGSEDVKESLDFIAESVNDLDFCYAALNKVSRSFATVIRQLPDELRDPVCIFYLVLRGLDSIEDDTSFPKKEKLPLLKNFYEKNHESNWNITGVGDSDDYRTLLANYDKVARSFQNLDAKYRLVIVDICKQMGAGMAEFSERPIRTTDDYDLYCHYVAGLVGVGLSDLFAVSGIENPELSLQPELSNSMGLFLQKTNIVRDYHEDLMSGRMFWPEEIWSKYAANLEDFKFAPQSPYSLACLNYLVCDALQHAPDCLDYVSQLTNPNVFRFCAIPQVMAIATLAKVYNNPEVFTGVVKIRKGLTAKLMMEVNDFESFRNHFNLFARDIFNKLNMDDTNNDQLLECLFQIFRVCSKQQAVAEFQPSFY
jgi:farnesyl-diphosphate farnesyltransferase